MDIDDVRERVKREERDPQRQMHRGELQMSGIGTAPSKTLSWSTRKFEYLKAISKPRLTTTATATVILARSRPASISHPPAQAIVDRDDRDHDQDVGSFSPDIEEQARGQQHQVAVPGPGERVEPEQDGQEDEQEEW